MPDIFEHPSFDDHNKICFVRDAGSGLRGIIAIHRYGRLAAGGIRMQSYRTTDKALEDALRLSRAMTYKLAVAGLPAGGAKSVIIGDPATDKTPQLLAAFGRAVEKLGGAYHCGADVGITADDIAVIGQHTQYTPPAQFGDLSIATAQGVFHGIRAGVKWALGRDTLEGISVAVQGLGQVGSRLCDLLSEAGCRLTVADVDAERCAATASRHAATVVPVSEVLSEDVDVLSPCALGSVLSDETVPTIRARVVCGAANNQLATPGVAKLLAERGIVYVPDFVANAGGVIGGLGVSFSYSEAEKNARIEGIYDSAVKILEMAVSSKTTTNDAAENLAREAMARA